MMLRTTTSSNTRDRAMAEAPRTDADKAALRERVLEERRRAQRARWSLAASGAGAVTAASLLALVATAWVREAHHPAPRAQVLTERRIVLTTRYVRPKPRIRIVKVLRPRPAATGAAGPSAIVNAHYAPASAPARTFASAPAPAPARQVQVQVAQPAPAPPPPPVSTHAS